MEGLVGDVLEEVVDVDVNGDDVNGVEVDDGKSVVDDNVAGDDKVVVAVVDIVDGEDGEGNIVDEEVGKDKGDEGEG